MANHFDTAPIYGFGLSERDLAPLLTAEPNLTVATKVGLYPPGGTQQNWAAVFARKALGKLYSPWSRASVDLSVKRAEVSLGASLINSAGNASISYSLVGPMLPSSRLKNGNAGLSGSGSAGG